MDHIRSMKPSRYIRPISYLKANAAEIIRAFESEPGTFVITQNGEAKAVFQDIRTHEETQAALAMLRILATGADDTCKGRVKRVAESFEAVRRGTRDVAPS